MVTGRLRAVLWGLGGLAVVWLLMCLAMFPAMGRLMSGGMMQGGEMQAGMMEGGMMDGIGHGSMLMMAMMVAQFIVMLGLAGVFIYLVLDSRRARHSPRRL